MNHKPIKKSNKKPMITASIRTKTAIIILIPLDLLPKIALLSRLVSLFLMFFFKEVSVEWKGTATSQKDSVEREIASFSGSRTVMSIVASMDINSVQCSFKTYIEVRKKKITYFHTYFHSTLWSTKTLIWLTCPCQTFGQKVNYCSMIDMCID